MEIPRRSLLVGLAAGVAHIESGASRPSMPALAPEIEEFKSIFFSYFKVNLENLRIWAGIQRRSDRRDPDLTTSKYSNGDKLETAYRVRFPTNPDFGKGLGFTADYRSYELTATINRYLKTLKVVGTSIGYALNEKGEIGLPKNNVDFDKEVLIAGLKKYTRQPYPQNYDTINYITFYGNRTVPTYTASYEQGDIVRKFALWGDGLVSISSSLKPGPQLPRVI